MKNWVKEKLGNIAQIVSGGTPSSNNPQYWESGKIHWATLPDLNKKYLHNTQRKITELGLKNSSAILLPIDSIIFSSRATIGELSITKVITSTNQGSKNLICDKNKVDPEFMYYSLKYNSKNIDQLSNGATYKEINKTDLANFEILLPSLQTQKDVSSILSAYDDLIENNEKRIKILEEMAMRLYREWFVKYRFPGHENVKMVDSGTEYGMVPEGWGVERLENLIYPQYGYTASAIENNSYPKYLRGTDINKKNWIDWSQIPNCQISDQDFEKYKINTGDIFIIRMADPGKIGICEIETKAVFASYLMRLNIKKSIKPYYLYYFLNSDRYQSYINGVSNGATRMSINSKHVGAINVITPPQEILDKFENKIFNYRKLLTLLILKNSNLSKIRDLLIPQLVTGRREVKRK